MGASRRAHRRRYSRNHNTPIPAEAGCATAEPKQEEENSSTSKKDSNQDALVEELSKIKNKSMFSPEQQKVIIEHLLITKNSAPQKNYSHVPCKFYRQGACQASESCPFSHSLDAFTADQRPCEYFKKGNCKFGMKCVNAHITDKGVDAKKPPVMQSTPPPMITQPVSQMNNNISTGAPPPTTSTVTPHRYPQYQEDDLEDVFEEEEYFLPNDFSDLLTPEELSHRRSRSSSSLTSDSLFHHNRSLSGNSTASSSSSFTSPLLHQQLAFLQAAQNSQYPPLKSPYNYTYMGRPLQFKNQPTWGALPPPPPAPSLGSPPVPHPVFFANDLATFRIEEEEAPFLLDDLPIFPLSRTG